MSFDDLILLNTQERLWDERDEVIPEHSTDKKLDGLESSCGLGSYSNIEGRRYTLPIYVYDCSMAGLIADLIQNDEEFDHCDIHLV